MPELTDQADPCLSVDIGPLIFHSRTRATQSFSAGSGRVQMTTMIQQKDTADDDRSPPSTMISLNIGISGLRTETRFPTIPGCQKTRSRLPHEAHEKVFGWVLNLVAERGLVNGERIGVDGSPMEANAAKQKYKKRSDGHWELATV
jgi:hypothetical protein